MILTHYTDARNLDAIKESGILKCALFLMTLDEMKIHAEKKRVASIPLACAVLRDQQPLYPRVALSNGATFANFVKYLNGHVFFLAGHIGREKMPRIVSRKISTP